MAKYNYDPFGRLGTVTSAGQINQSYAYDGFDRSVAHKKRDGATLKTTSYTYDPLDRATAKTDNAGTPQAKTTTFAYLGLTDNGYVGIEAGFAPGDLHLGADLADMVGQDRTDEGDEIAIQIGIDLRKKYSPEELRPEHIYYAMLERYDDLQRTGKISPCWSWPANC